MRPLTSEVLREVAKGNEPPCISLFQPTHRANPDSLQDPIPYKNLVRDAELPLREKYSGWEIGPLLEPFHALANDYYFWTHQRDGLAILAAGGAFEVLLLQRPVKELVVVADGGEVVVVPAAKMPARTGMAAIFSSLRSQCIHRCSDGKDQKAPGITIETLPA